jgi:hypothetical protein
VVQRLAALLLTLLALVVVVPVRPGASVAVGLTANHALKGTQIPVFNITSDDEIRGFAVQYGVGTTADPAAVVDYPASWAPLSPGGFADPTWDQSVRAGVVALRALLATDSAPVVFGYSQGAVVASEFKKQLNANPTPGVIPEFVFVGNGARPNGGVLSRFQGVYVPLLDMTATGNSPTHTTGAAPGRVTTRDYAGQYDPIADFPTNPLNPFALLNAGLGALFVHLSYENAGGAVRQDVVGDTAYYLIPTYPVPLLMPVQMIPVIGPVLADTLDPLVRVLVEMGYDRTISPGQPTPASVGYAPNPAALAHDVPHAAITGLDNLFQNLGLGRPLQTARPDVGPGTTGQGAYGVGGPPVTMTPAADTTAVEDPQRDPPDIADARPRLNVVRPSVKVTPGGSDATETDTEAPQQPTPAATTPDPTPPESDPADATNTAESTTDDGGAGTSG